MFSLQHRTPYSIVSPMFRPLMRARWPQKFPNEVFLQNRSWFQSRSAASKDNPVTESSGKPYWHLDATGSPTTAAHVQAQQDLVVVDRILEPQTIMQFICFAFGNPLPTGSRPSSITSLTEEEFAFMQGNHPASSSVETESVIHHIMVHIGSNEDAGRLCGIGKNIHTLKSRLWEGITPLSDQRWQEKGLHLPENLGQACQHLSAVVAVFEYLNVEQVRGNLRVTFNLIHDLLEALDPVLNERRTEIGEEHVSVANLWTIFMTAHLEVVTQRAHKWVTQHIDALRAPIMQDLLNHQSSKEGTGEPDEMQWKFGNALHLLLEISVRADYMIIMPMEGWKGYAAPENGNGPPEMYVADATKRGEAYAERVKLLSHEISFNKLMKDISSGDIPKLTSGESYHESAMEQIVAQTQVRRELRGESIDSVLQEPWITSRLCNIQSTEYDLPKDCGLAIYRLTYGQSESEWSEFVQNMEKHIANWGTGQTGSDAIKPYLKLHWIDGKELGFAEGDIEAAKSHYNKLLNDDSTENPKTTVPLGLQPKAFLAIDSASFASYQTKSDDTTTSLVPPDDSTGFILAIDSQFDPKEGLGRPEESPGYSGQMRVLGSLVWGDLYAILESQSAELHDLWPLAMHHPNQVYIGPTIPLQVANWRAQSPGHWNVLGQAMQAVKGKLGWGRS